jgi:hypothetical protein
MNTEKVKVGLLALIALVLIVNTYFVAMGSGSELTTSNSGDFSSDSYSSIPQQDGDEIQQGLDKSNSLQNVSSDQFKNSAVEANANNPTLNALPNANSNVATGPVTNIKFASDYKDFGEIKAQSENVYAFEFINTGNEPLVIENAKGSCGCTVPDWPRDPILPGAKGLIDVVFKPKTRETKGEDQKTVTVTANTNPKNTVLTIRALVNP